jgi:3-oxosteroid 1-dehydrogenase
MSWDEEFDLVSVGSGAGGLSAAITAADEGAKAVVLEKGPLLGGVTALSLGQIWLGNNHLAQAAGIADSAEETRQYLDFLAAGLIDPVRQQGFIEHAREALVYFHRAGFPAEVIRNCPDYYFPRAPGSKAEGRYVEVEAFDLRELGELREKFLVSPHGWGYMSNADIIEAGGDLSVLGEMINRHVENQEVLAGSGISAWLVKMAADRHVDMRVNHRARRLVKDDGGIVGLEVDTPEGTRTIRTRGVVLATGGYDWNSELVRSFELLPEMESMTQPTVEGDHIVMATQVGGMIAPSPTVANPILVGFHIPGEELDGRPVYHGHSFPGAHLILVNPKGKRFSDESFYPSVVSELSRYDRLKNEYPNRPTWMIFDQNFRDKYVLGFKAPGEPLPEGTTVVADTIREVAEKAGIDAAALEATVERYNEYCGTGVDEEFGRGSWPWAVQSWGDKRLQPNPVMGSLDKPPYHALKLVRVGMGIPSAGLKVDTIGRVLDATNATIPGLYAAGNAAARLDTGGYQSGTANARGLMLGYLAARDVAGALSVASRPVRSAPMGA